MQTIKFKTPDSDTIHTYETDDALWDTWGVVKVDGEDYDVNVWFDDPDDGILLAIYPYEEVDGEIVTQYDDYIRCTIVNVDELTVDVNKPEPEEKLANIIFYDDENKWYDTEQGLFLSEEEVEQLKNKGVLTI